LKLLSLLIGLTLLTPYAVGEGEVNLPESEIQLLIMNYSDNAPNVYFRCLQNNEGEWCTAGQKIEDRWL
jgi:hypothetical protein